MTDTSSAAPAARRRSMRGALVLGVFALTGGLWLLLSSQGVELAIGRLWPIFFLLGGFASLIDYAMSRSTFSAAMTVIGVGLGVLGFALTYDYTTLGRMLDWLPSFPTILGLAFLAAWLAGGRKSQGLLVAGIVFAALGVLGFGARFEWLQAILPSAQIVWAILLLVGGGLILWRVFRPGGQAP